LLVENNIDILSAAFSTIIYQVQNCVNSRRDIMRVTTGIVFLHFLVILSICMNSIQCKKGKQNKEERKSQTFPPCAACRILTNSFKKVNPMFTLIYVSIKFNIL